MINSINNMEQLRNEFNKYYETQIFPCLTQVEELRKRYVSGSKILCLVMTLIVIGFSIYFTTALDNNISKIAFIFFFIIGGFIVCTIPYFRFKNRSKEILMPIIINFFDGFEYKYKESLSDSIIRNSGILPNYSRNECDDYIQGKHKDVSVTIAETKLTKIERLEKRKRTITVFKGLLILFDMNKPFSSRTLVRTDKGGIGNLLNKELFSSLETVKLEDPRFEEIFEVYSTNQIEARYLLTTAFMERLIKLTDIFDTSGVQASFFDNHLFLAIPQPHDFFEAASIFNSVINKQRIEKVINEILFVMDIIEVLNLNQEIGM